MSSDLVNTTFLVLMEVGLLSTKRQIFGHAIQFRILPGSSWSHMDFEFGNLYDVGRNAKRMLGLMYY